MAAVTRWVNYSVDAEGAIGDGDNGCKGTQGYSIATASVGDTFTIGPTTNRLHLSIGGVSAPYITLYSGSNLDPRFVARDITEKLRALIKGTEDYDKAICKWENDGDNGNRFAIYPGELGVGSIVTVTTSGVSNSAHAVLGWTTKDENGGAATSNTFAGTASVSGTYYGLVSEVYKVVISNDADANRGIGSASVGGGNTYAGTMTTGGVFNNASDIEYVINIDVSNGATMGGGTGNVPTMTWTSTGNADDSSVETELLYPDTWYKVGSKGLMVKFTDAVFVTASPAWTIQCYKPDNAGGGASAPVGTAQYVYSSDRGDMSSSPTTTISGSYTVLGSRGVSIKFNPTGGGDNLAAGDEFYVICAGPDNSAPAYPNVTSINYGNVTVSTESAVKCVMFEIESGAVQMSTVKFGLQSHGTFSHHETGNNDTYFRFGTVGMGNNAGSGDTDGIEWYPNVTAADIDGDTPPSYLYATDDNLLVVSTADASEAIGNSGLVADPIWLNIRLGAAETGANSTINYRLYFDYS
jgi:hypothetical protein